tara:strand:+ start:184 stop:507 length:324 start_codon:yes stop_codon:yes gene_type:complete
MTKKGPLSKAEKFYIESHLHLSVGVLCKDLDRAKSTVQKYCKTLTPEEQESGPAKIAIQETPAMSQFARNDKGSVVMTENASVASDDHRSKKRDVPPRSKRCTTRIR